MIRPAKLPEIRRDRHRSDILAAVCRRAAEVGDRVKVRRQSPPAWPALNWREMLAEAKLEMEHRRTEQPRSRRGAKRSDLITGTHVTKNADTDTSKRFGVFHSTREQIDPPTHQPPRGIGIFLDRCPFGVDGVPFIGLRRISLPQPSRSGPSHLGIAQPTSQSAPRQTRSVDLYLTSLNCRTSRQHGHKSIKHGLSMFYQVPANRVPSIVESNAVREHVRATFKASCMVRAADSGDFMGGVAGDKYSAC